MSGTGRQGRGAPRPHASRAVEILQAVITPRAVPEGSTFLALRWGEISSVGRFEAHICRKCGHTELYLADVEALDKLRTG